jgi:3'(2'), 5'-bisphosphate nucleotidase
MTEQKTPPFLDIAIEACLAGGKEINAVYAGSFSVDHKADDSPLTEADRRSHTAIAALLATTGLPVLSEEGGSIDRQERMAWQRYWCVDPLDGTKEFVKRNGEFTVNIALMERDELPAGALGSATPVMGLLYAPDRDVLYFAWIGGGAYRQEKAATHEGVSAYERLAMATRLPSVEGRNTYTILASRSHRSPETDAFIQRMEKEHADIAIDSMGSALKFGLLAEGTADAYPRYAPTMEWDTAAGQVICTEAGKQLIDVTTDAPMRYNKHELVNNWFIVQ